MELRVSWLHSQDVAVAEGLMEVGELASTVSHGGDWPVLPVGTWPLLLGSRASAWGCFRGGLQMSLLLSVLSTVGLAWSQAGSAVGYSTCFHVS